MWSLSGRPDGLCSGSANFALIITNFPLALTSLPECSRKIKFNNSFPSKHVIIISGK